MILKFLQKIRAAFFNKPSDTGLLLASFLFALSLFPSMIPRPFILQGLLSGFSMATGYAMGVLLVALWQYMQLPDIGARLRRYMHLGLGGIVAVICLLSLYFHRIWQARLREVMGLPEQEAERIIGVALIALITASVLLLLARAIKLMYYLVASKVHTRISGRIGKVSSVTLVVVLLTLFSNQFVIKTLVNWLDAIYASSDALTDSGVERPGNGWQSGSQTSFIAWQSIGRTGQNFVSTGPDKTNIGGLFEQDKVLHPLRVYVGLRSAESVEARAKLALEELKRIGGFERSKLVVATPTGTGWIDPSGVDPFEYLHKGDTAIVTMQYSYLPSWLTLLLDPTRSNVSSRALFQQVYRHWITLPKDKRPELYLYGLSLGALGAETSFDFSSLLRDPIQGGVFAGAPFTSRIAPMLMQHRAPGSPQWQPIIEDGSFVRFTAQENALAIPGATWGSVRFVYIQYASDPMVFFREDLYFREPDWIKGERGPDISPDLKWMPVLTFLQVLFDLPMADRVPKGVAHNYSAASYIDAWIAVSQPAMWSEKKTHALKHFFDGR